MIWFEDVTEIINVDKLTSFWPSKNQSEDERINSSSRFIIYASLISFGFKRDPRIIILGCLILVGLYLLYKMKPAISNEPFNSQDPMSNLTDDKVFEEEKSSIVMSKVFPDDKVNAERNFYTVPVNDVGKMLQANGRGEGFCKENQDYCNLETNVRWAGMGVMRAKNAGVNYL
jgi:hypothetical protein